jgi:hypothetical protein
MGEKIRAAIDGAAPLRFAAGGPVPETTSASGMDLKDYGVVTLNAAGRGYPVMGKKQVIEAVIEEIQRGRLLRAN